MAISAKFIGASVMLLALVLCCGPAGAQSLQGVFSGEVRDSSGGMVIGADVTIRNAASNAIVFRGKTDRNGAYVAPAIPAANYHLSFVAPGFSTVEIRDVSLQVDQRATISAVLSPGQVSESVTVVGEALGKLKTESSSIDEVITSSQVRSLPLASRNALNLLSLVGGVSAGGGPTSPNSSQISMNGSRPLNNEVMVDGVSVLSGQSGSITRLPSTEAIREVKILTSAYSAEYGRTSGGFVNAVIDSGTKDYHGGLYEYFRNEVLNANNFFNNAQGLPRQSDRYNQFGGKLGGPVRVPKLYDGKDRTFFFFIYEGLRRTSPSTRTSTIADESFRLGDFSSSPVAVRDPSTGAPFPGNRIPSGRIDSAAARIMSHLPAPNQAGTADPANGRRLNNYSFQESVKPFSDEITLRLDHSFSEGKSRVFGRYTWYEFDNPAGRTMPGPLNNRRGNEMPAGHQLSAGYTRMISPSLFLELNFALGYNNQQQVLAPDSAFNVPEVLGIQRASWEAAPRFNISNYSTLGIESGTLSSQITITPNTTAAVTWTNSRHLVKMGVQVRNSRFDVFAPTGDFSGTYNFNGEVTHTTNATGNPVNSLADMLLGRIQTGQYSVPQPAVIRSNYNLGLFVQDDWKVSRNLTLNLGMRYEYESPIVVSDNIYSRINPVTGGLLAAGKNASRALDMSAPRFNLAPRVGVAYSIGPNTVIRSAAGLFFGQVFSNLGGGVNFPGFSATQVFPDLGIGVAQPFALREGMPLTARVDLSDPFFVERIATPANPLSPSAQFTGLSPLPSSWQWNFGLQHEVKGWAVFDASYVATRGLHLPLSLAENAAPFGRADELALVGSNLAIQNARPFPTVTQFGSTAHAGDSSYHSLQTRATRQFSNLVLLGSYTWSKAIDDGSGLGANSQPNGLDAGQFPYLYRRLDRSVSAFDRRHAFTLALQYTTKGPWWLRDIQIAPIFVTRTGLADTITQSNLHPSVVQQRPHAIGSNEDLYVTPVSTGTAIRYLMPANDPAFPLAPSGPLVATVQGSRRLLIPASIGTLGRNTIRLPGATTLDLAVSRRFRVTEKAWLLVRAEAFNALNQVNLGAPSTALAVSTTSSGQPIFNSPSFGLITSALGARSMQMVLRLEF